MSNLQLKCKKCRNVLTEDFKKGPLSAHGLLLDTENVREANKHCLKKSPEVFYFVENCMPRWIRERVDDANWLKGKLTCAQCSAKLGSFDFVHGSKCDCDAFVLPPVHLIRSKVDYAPY
ncbi:E3 ubiquitin-protein ligase RNF180-like [Nilaparvata lugens]|uniref:E3 ubiquitin-protein ligase RNF180-like n=1 Tax=Nilaparvata lugens TaxID=108931 RepID=UPI00193E6A35|nr:E3 ubiquitin-protein ligase RNF180-like [Nilaparvata lugens]